MKRLFTILCICLLLGFVLIGFSIYIQSGYKIPSDFAVLLTQHLGLAICFPIIIGLVFEKLSRERILRFVEESLISLIDLKQRFFVYGFATVEIGPDEQQLRDQMFKETEEATKATFLFLRAGLILRVLVPVFRRILDKNGAVTIISPEYDSEFVTSVVHGVRVSSQIAGGLSLPRIDTREEIQKRDGEMALDYEQYLNSDRLKILKTNLYIPYGCLLLEKKVHGNIERVAYWFPFVISKTCGYGPVFRISKGKMLDILSEDIAIYIKTSPNARFQRGTIQSSIL